ncbi:MAG TPA: hypothetical protein VHD33_01720 [Legionellaceae bacterium]|nr:hypothetical protein [Legionellaceae bacterium]
MDKFVFNDEQTIKIPSGAKVLDGIFFIPQDALGFVLFTHGSGSNRFSTRINTSQKY